MDKAGVTPPRELRVEVQIKSVRRVLLTVVAVLTAASLVVQISQLVFDHPSLLGFGPVFDSDREGNMPTLLSAIALLGCWTLATVIAASEQRVSRRSARPWWVLSLVFLLAALDEGAGLHESFGTRLGDFADVGYEYRGYFWIVPGAGLFLLLGLYYRSFVAGLAADVRRTANWGAGLFVFGAVGLEVVESQISASTEGDTLGSALVTVTQEALEMVGVVLLLEALLRYLASRRVIVHAAVGEPSSRLRGEAASKRANQSYGARASDEASIPAGSARAHPRR